MRDCDNDIDSVLGQWPSTSIVRILADSLTAWVNALNCQVVLFWPWDGNLSGNLTWKEANL